MAIAKISEAEPVKDVLAIPEKPPRTQEEWLARQADRIAISEVLHRYGQYCDSKNYEGVLTLYTDDIERVLGGTLTERVTGKKDLLDKYLNPSLQRKNDGKAARPMQGVKSRHMMLTPVIKIADDGKQAWVSSYFTLASSRGEGKDFTKGSHEGTYLFELVKQGFEWKIKKFVVNTEIGNDPLFRPQK